MDCTEARRDNLAKQDGAEFGFVAVPDEGCTSFSDDPVEIRGVIAVGWWTKATVREGIVAHVRQLVGEDIIDTVFDALGDGVGCHWCENNYEKKKEWSGGDVGSASFVSVLILVRSHHQ